MTDTSFLFASLCIADSASFSIFRNVSGGRGFVCLFLIGALPYVPRSRKKGFLSLDKQEGIEYRGRTGVEFEWGEETTIGT